MKTFRLLLLVFALGLCSCSNEFKKELAIADSLITSADAGALDSTLAILDSVDPATLSREAEAHWSLLHTWALFRKYEKEIPLEPLELAFDYYKDSKDPLRRAQVYYLHSVVREDQKDGDASEWIPDLYVACLEIEKTDDHVLAGQLYQRYANILYHKERFEESLKWESKFLESARKSGRKLEECNALLNYSLSLYYLYPKTHEKFHSCIDTISKALKIAQAEGLKTMEGKVCSKLSFFYSRAEQYDSALFYARKGLEIDKQQYELGQRRKPANHIAMCEVFRRMGVNDSAVFYAMKEVDNPDPSIRMNAFQLLYMIYYHTDDAKKSVYWMTRFTDLRDSIHDAMEGAKMNGLEQTVERSEALSDKNSLYRDYFHWIGVGVVLLLGFVFLIVRYMRKNQREFQHKMKAQEEEINRLISAQNRSTEKEEVPAETGEKVVPTVVHLVGSTKEQLTLNPEDILYLTAEGNYVKVVYLDLEGKVVQKCIRQTMSQVAVMLENYPQIVRCHRAFFVGLRHVVHAKSVSTGLILSLKDSSVEIPVSRTYISDITQRL